MFTLFVGVARAELEEAPLVIVGSELPQWQGVEVSEIFAFVFDADSMGWERIPFQIDEREYVQLDGCTGAGPNSTYLTYVFGGSEGNGLDENDELVLMLEDGLGDRAPLAAAPPDVDPTRFELVIRDGSDDDLGFAYLFSASVPPAPDPPADYVHVSFQSLGAFLEDTSIETARYRVHYGARWRIDGISVLPPHGDGRNVLDRVKFRVFTDDSARAGETEETWDLTSCYLGHKDGPIRAIREIQGAASGMNTTYADVYYGSWFVKRVSMRVHAVSNLVYFFDYHPDVAGPSLTYYNQHNPLGVAIDGVADPFMSMELSDWELVSHAEAGGLLLLRQEALPLPGGDPVMFWWDDASFLDVTGDHEPGRYGCHGTWYPAVADTETPGHEGFLQLTFVPVEAGDDGSGAEMYDDLVNPPTVVVVPQTSSCGNGACEPGECAWCGSDCSSCLDGGVPDADAEDAGFPDDLGPPADEGGGLDAGPPSDRWTWQDEGGGPDAGPSADQGLPPDSGCLEDAEITPDEGSAPPDGSRDSGASDARVEDLRGEQGPRGLGVDAGASLDASDASRGCACRAGWTASTGDLVPLFAPLVFALVRRRLRPVRMAGRDLPSGGWVATNVPPRPSRPCDSGPSGREVA